MGKWFPDIRTATPEQAAAYRQAIFDLHRHGEYESKLRTADGKRAITDESPRYLDLNDRAWETEQPLSRLQRTWHWHKAANEQDKDMTRLQRASERQDRAMRRARSSR